MLIPGLTGAGRALSRLYRSSLALYSGLVRLSEEGCTFRSHSLHKSATLIYWQNRRSLRIPVERLFYWVPSRGVPRYLINVYQLPCKSPKAPGDQPRSNTPLREGDRLLSAGSHGNQTLLTNPRDVMPDISVYDIARNAQKNHQENRINKNMQTPTENSKYYLHYLKHQLLHRNVHR